MVGISIVIPLYNKEATIIAAACSVLSQMDYLDELIVVDDGSTDESLKRINHVKDSRLIVKSFSNSGPGAARNRGSALARNSFIAFLDGDDIWKPGALEEFRDLISINGEAGLFSFGNMRFTRAPVREDTAGASSQNNRGSSTKRFLEGAKFLKEYARQEIVNSSSVCLSARTLEAVGGFPEGVQTGEDVYVWMRAALLSGAMVSDARLCNVKGREPSASLERSSLPYHYVWFSAEENLKQFNESERKEIRHFLSARALQVCGGLILEGRREDAQHFVGLFLRVNPCMVPFLVSLLSLPKFFLGLIYRLRRRCLESV